MAEVLGLRFFKALVFLWLFAATPALAYSPPPNCPSNSGAQALNYATATNAFSCNAVAGGVSSFTGDSALLSNSASTGAVTATLANAAANTVWGNNTSGSATPGYQTAINVSGNITGAAGAFTTGAFSSTITGTSTSANALAIGTAGATNPVFNVDASTSSAVAGLDVIGAATGGTVVVEAIDSGSNTNLSLSSKGIGTLLLNSGGNGKVGIGTTTPTNLLSLKGSAGETIWMERSASTGNNLTLQAGGGVALGTNEAGGNLILSAGISTGSGSGNINLKVFPAGSSGTGDNSATTVVTVCSGGITIGSVNCPGHNGIDIEGVSASGIQYDVNMRNTYTAANGNGARLGFEMNNAAASGVEFATIDGVVASDTTSSEQGKIVFNTVNSGTLAQDMQIDGISVSIGTTSTTAYLNVGTTGQFTVSSAGNLATSGSVTFTGLTNADTGDYVCYNAGVIEYDATACLASLRKYKRDIAPITGALAEIMKLKPVEYRYKADYKHGEPNKLYVGFIAEDVEAVDLRIAAHNDKGELEGVDYQRMVALPIAAIQEMQNEISATTGAFPFHKCFFDLLVCAD